MSQNYRDENTTLLLSQSLLSEKKKTLNMSLMYYDQLSAKFIVSECFRLNSVTHPVLAIVSLLVSVTLRATSSTNSFSPYSEFQSNINSHRSLSEYREIFLKVPTSPITPQIWNFL